MLCKINSYSKNSMIKKKKHIISYCIILYLKIIISYRIILWYIISYHIILCYIISYHTIWYQIISYNVLFHYIMSYYIKVSVYYIASYHIISYHIELYSIKSYHIISNKDIISSCFILCHIYIYMLHDTMKTILCYPTNMLYQHLDGKCTLH